MSFDVYKEIIKVDVNPATILIAPHAHRKFAICGEYTEVPTNYFEVVSNADEVNALPLTQVSKDYINKWFAFGGKEITIIHKNIIGDETAMNSLPAYNILVDSGNMTFTEQVNSVSSILDIKYKYFYFSCSDADLTSQQAIDNKRNCAVFIDNDKAGRWQNYLVGYETLDNYPREDYLITSLLADTKLDIDGSGGYLIGNLKNYLIDNKVAGIFSNSYKSVNEMFNVYSKYNLPVRLNFLMEDIINTAVLTNADFLQEFEVPFNDFGAKALVGKSVRALKKYGKEQLKQVIGYPVSTIIPVKNMPVKGTFSGQTIGYKAKLFGRFNEIVANESV